MNRWWVSFARTGSPEEEGTTVRPGRSESENATGTSAGSETEGDSGHTGISETKKDLGPSGASGLWKDVLLSNEWEYWNIEPVPRMVEMEDLRTRFSRWRHSLKV